MLGWGPDRVEFKDWTPPAWLAWVSAFALVALFGYAFDDASTWPKPAPVEVREALTEP